MKNMLVETSDGSKTIFSSKYNQNFHNVKDGAINESLYKHIIPAFTYHSNKKHLNILDICFGIGYNTLLSIYYIQKNNIDTTLTIYSPELDKNLVESLLSFPYPKEFKSFKKIIESICSNNSYEDELVKIYISIGNARNYIKTFDYDFFNIVYQDAFSSEVNHELWTKEYFDDIYKVCNRDAILTTYSISTPVRMSLNEANFFIYEEAALNKKITLATKIDQKIIGKKLDMDDKKTRSPKAFALYDLEKIN